MRIDIHRYDDWAVVYRDGKSIYQGHSVRPEALLSALGIEVHSKYIDLGDGVLQEPIPLEIPCE